MLWVYELTLISNQAEENKTGGENEEEEKELGFIGLIKKPIIDIYYSLMKMSSISMEEKDFLFFLNLTNSYITKLEQLKPDFDQERQKCFESGIKMLENDFSDHDFHRSIFLPADSSVFLQYQEIQESMNTIFAMKFALVSLHHGENASINIAKIPSYFEMCSTNVFKFLQRDLSKVDKALRDYFYGIALDTLREWAKVFKTYLISINTTPGAEPLKEEHKKIVEMGFELAIQYFEITGAGSSYKHSSAATREFVLILLIATSLHSGLEEKLYQPQMIETILRFYSLDENEVEAQSEIALLVMKIINRSYPWHIFVEMRIKRLFLLNPDKKTMEYEEMIEQIPELKNLFDKNQMTLLANGLSRIFEFSGITKEKFLMTIKSEYQDLNKRNQGKLISSKYL